MLGSSISICPNIMLNTIMAEELNQFTRYSRKSRWLHSALNDLIVKTIKEHKRIIAMETTEWMG